MINEGEYHWFPLRIRNSSLSRLQDIMRRLERQDCISEVYAPIAFIKTRMTKMDFAPFLMNYIFVYTSFSKLVEVKNNKEEFEPIRFVMHPVYDEKYKEHSEVLFISDKTMADYKLFTEKENEKVIFLDNMDYVCKPSQIVQITEGQFAGVIGRIKRIGGNRCVVLPIGKEFALGVMDLPRKHLRYLDI